ncbi:hypothetical protein PMIT1313_00065 [Prochlorococcus marinus str. MIT 1313]|nr:hypothetical protein PMIT1313_00065 [Prochlorococcus marinus str. MIT 1313]
MISNSFFHSRLVKRLKSAGIDLPYLVRFLLIMIAVPGS